MTVVQSTDVGNLGIWDVLSHPFILSAADANGFTASNSYGTVVVSGSGLTYAPNSITGGTITSFGYALNGVGSMGAAGFAVAAVLANNALAAQNFWTFLMLLFTGPGFIK
jgi:hypothetical protein